MQHKLTQPSRLLDKRGELIQKGYATSPILEYNRENAARKLRLKEWDYYLIYNENCAVALTVGKTAKLLLISATLIDFINHKELTKSIVRLVSKKIFSMPVSSKTGDIHYRDDKVSLSIIHRGSIRELYLLMNEFDNGSELEVSLKLFPEPQDSMVIATPFKESKKDFYYNQKIIGMNASGAVHLKDQIYTLDYYNSLGLLDWGRGVWPYKTTWYWSAGQGMVCGKLFGFNLGYGFGDTSAATENMLFYNGIANKLEEVKFYIPKNKNNQYDYMKPWTITSSDQRFEMVFIPTFDRSMCISAVLLSTNQHQVFGRFTGTAVLDDGSRLFIKDFPGFIERVVNRW